MDLLLQQELAEAGLRLRRLISRVVNETPECLAHKNGKWSVEFRNPATGESITVTYAGGTVTHQSTQQN